MSSALSWSVSIVLKADRDWETLSLRVLEILRHTGTVWSVIALKPSRCVCDTQRDSMCNTASRADAEFLGLPQC